MTKIEKAVEELDEMLANNPIIMDYLNAKCEYEILCEEEEERRKWTK